MKYKTYIRALDRVLNVLININVPRPIYVHDVPLFSLTPLHAKIRAKGELYKPFVHGEPNPLNFH